LQKYLLKDIYDRKDYIHKHKVKIVVRSRVYQASQAWTDEHGELGTYTSLDLIGDEGKEVLTVESSKESNILLKNEIRYMNLHNHDSSIEGFMTLESEAHPKDYDDLVEDDKLFKSHKNDLDVVIKGLKKKFYIGEYDVYISFIIK